MVSRKEFNKPVIETLVNTVALALTTFGVQQIMANKWDGYLAISFGMIMEFLKYMGRHKKYW